MTKEKHTPEEGLASKLLCFGGFDISSINNTELREM